MQTPGQIIASLELEPIPDEGGWFRRIATGPEDAEGSAAWSSIVALLTSEGFSALHRLQVDEVWCFNAGDPVEMLLLHPGGRIERPRLDASLSNNSGLQRHIGSGIWQGGRPAGPRGWSLVSCVCVPGFRPDRFELGKRDQLLSEYPAAEETIRQLTRVVPPS